MNLDDLPRGKTKRALEFPHFPTRHQAVVTLLNPEMDPFPDGILRRYADMGLTGVWMQAMLYSLYPLEAAREFSEGWEKRLETLRNLVRRAGKFGVGIYLYLNEPRGMPEDFFRRMPEWKGVRKHV